MNKTMMMIIPIALIGIVAGLGFAGVINIPGLTPANKPGKSAEGMYAADKDDKAKLAAKKKTPPVVDATAKKTDTTKPVAKPVIKDPEQGADALAAVWNEIKTPELLKIVAKWKDQDLVVVLMHMDNDKVATILSAMTVGDKEAKLDPNPERASKLSKILQDRGSIVKPAS